MGKLKKPQKPNPNDQLLTGIKNDEAEIKKYAKLLKIKKRKNKSTISDIFQDLDPVSSDGEDAPQDNSDQEMDTSDQEDMSCVEEEDEECEELSSEDEKKQVEKPTKESSAYNADQMKIKRSILNHLNKLCESQMMKCLDGIEETWNAYPRGDVRDIFIRESLSYMTLSCIDLAAFIASLHIRLVKHTNLIAFYMEYLVEKLSGLAVAHWGANEATFGTVMVGYKFIGYMTRLEMIDTNLIIDIMHEMVATPTCDIPQLKVLAELASIIGFFIRKHNAKRCDEFVTVFRQKMASAAGNMGDISEMSSLSEAVIDKLTTSKAKNDVVYQQMVKYRKLMRTWCRRTITQETLALRLSDFRGENRVRWWLVGSAVNPNVAHNKSTSATDKPADNREQLNDQDVEWNQLATSLGFGTEGKQALFRTLMRGKANPDQDEISEAMESIRKLSKCSSGDNSMIVPESEVVSVVVRCLALDKHFCQFYVNLLAAMIEANRKYRQLVKCAMWDVLAQPKLVDSARANIGRCLGQLIAIVEFPVNSLKKFNFMDDSSANVAFMTAVMCEIAEESWDDMSALYRLMASTISTKFVSNLRLFLKKNFKATSTVISRSVLLKVDRSIEFLHELRKNTQ